MRRIFGVGLFLLSAWLARPAMAQKPVVSAKADSIGTATGRIAVADSVQYQVRWCARTTRGEAIGASGNCTSVTLPWWIKAKPDTVKPPTPPDTTKPPTPPDTTKPPVPPAGVLFSSDWRAATGTSTAALTDGGKWTNTWEPCPPAPIDIIPNPGTFPAAMKNVVRVRNGNNGNCQWIQGHNLWPLPAIGKSVAFRVYLRSEIPDAVGSKNWASLHPMESGYNSGTSGGFWEWKMGNNANGTFPLTFETNELDLTFGPSDGTGPAGVKKFETWRLEWKFTRTAAGRYGLDVRIYDHTDKLVYDKTNTYMAWGRTQILANAGSNFAIDDAQIQQARVGINGGPTMSGVVYVYWGGFAVCTDWCGAY